MYLEKAIENIKKINWEEYKKQRGQQIILNDFVLVYEYLRRLASFFKKQKQIKDDNEKIVGMNSDFILIMNNLLKLSDEKSDEISANYNFLLKNISIPNIYYKNIMIFYIYLSVLIDENKLGEENFYIYDPLLKLLKNGGIFYRGSREINLGSRIQIPFYGWYEDSINRPEIDIEKIELKFKEII